MTDPYPMITRIGTDDGSPPKRVKNKHPYTYRVEKTIRTEHPVVEHIVQNTIWNRWVQKTTLNKNPKKGCRMCSN